MKFKHTDYSEGVHYFTLSGSAADLGLDDRFPEEVSVNCKMDKSHGQISLICEIEVEAHLNCDRCTSDFTTGLKNKIASITIW